LASAVVTGSSPPVVGATGGGDTPDLYASDMASIVLRIRLTNGAHIDVRYEDPEIAEIDDLIEHAVSELAEDSGILRTRHGDRMMVLYGRGVAGLEVAPRGAVL
jgi:hypothetical protein